MLTTDYQFLNGILATRMLPYMSDIIYQDQSGFIPQRNTAFNIHCVLGVIEAVGNDNATAMILSIVMEKALIL